MNDLLVKSAKTILKKFENGETIDANDFLELSIGVEMATYDGHISEETVQDFKKYFNP